MRFATTRWSLVLAAGAGPSERADRALAELCTRYWHPLYAYVRRRGYAPDDACDLTQAFFARLIEQRRLTAADPVRGRFRSSLLTSMKNFVASEWRRESAVKRGGGADVVSIDAADDAGGERMALARGIVEIGDMAVGLVAIGGFAFGGVTMGGMTVGVISLGGLAAGLPLAISGMALGGFAAGALAFGVLATGASAGSMLDLSTQTMQWASLAAWALATAVVTAIVAGLIVWWRDAGDGESPMERDDAERERER